MKVQINPSLSYVDLSALLEADVLHLSANALTDVDLDSLKTAGELMLSYNSLSDLDGLAALESAENLYAIGNELANVHGLSSLKAIVGSLDLSQNQLIGISGLENLERVGLLNLTSNPVTDLAPLAGIQALSGLSLQACPELTSLDGLGNLSGLDGLTITDAHKLTDISGIAHFKRIGALSLADVPELTSLEALEGVELANVKLSGMPQLSDLSPLSETVATIDYLFLYDLAGLKSIQPLRGLTQVQDLSLIATGLESLDGLQDLEQVELALYVEENPALTDLRVLEGLTGGSIFVVGNTSLPACEVDWLFAHSSWSTTSATDNDDGGVCP